MNSYIVLYINNTIYIALKDDWKRRQDTNNTVYTVEFGDPVNEIVLMTNHVTAYRTWDMLKDDEQVRLTEFIDKQDYI